MKKLIMLLAIVAITVTLSNDVFAQGGKMQQMKQLRTNFVDLDGDGINNNRCNGFGIQRKNIQKGRRGGGKR